MVHINIFCFAINTKFYTKTICVKLCILIVLVRGGVTSSKPIGGCGVDVITARRTRSLWPIGAERVNLATAGFRLQS